jgi:hypothetical protein
MKTIILITVLLGLGNNSFAQEKNKKQNQKESLNYEECVTKYGVDDTSIAIINVYFDRRYNAGTGQMSFLPITLVLTAITPPIGLGLTIVSSPMFVNGLIVRNRYSHKNMIKALDNYHSEKILSDKVRRKVTNYMLEEQEDKQLEQLEEYVTTLKGVE